MDIIRCDDEESLIVKWNKPNSKNSNSIELGSSLRVKPGQVALFLYKQDKDTYEEYIEGPFDEILVTKNIPVISNVLKLAYHGDTPFQAEIYFININKIIKTKFGVPYFNVFDYEYDKLSVPVSVRGSMNYRVTDYKTLIKLFGARTITSEDFYEYIVNAIKRYVKATVTNIPEQMKLSCLKLETQIDFISQVIEGVLKNRLKEEYGIELMSLDVSALEINKESEDYKAYYKAVTKQSIRNIIHKARLARAKDDLEVTNDVLDIVDRIVNIIKKAKHL